MILLAGIYYPEGYSEKHLFCYSAPLARFESLFYYHPQILIACIGKIRRDVHQPVGIPDNAELSRIDFLCAVMVCDDPAYVLYDLRRNVVVAQNLGSNRRAFNFLVLSCR